MKKFKKKKVIYTLMNKTTLNANNYKIEEILSVVEGLLM